MSEHADDTRHALLTAAAKAVAVAGVGDAERYLRAYYRRIAGSELAAAGADRLAAVAAEHAEFAAHRPQGRALARVRPGGEAAFDAGRAVIEIVTDDMPFLVDSITMALAAHDLSARLVIHPQLRVRRDVSGALHDVLGLVNGAAETHDEIAESWTHLELPRLAADEAEGLTAHLQRVLADVRVAVEDFPRMRARAVQLADQVADSQPGMGPGEQPDGPESPAEIAALLRWLADGHFIFLGYREYDLERGDEGLMLRRVPGTGLGFVRHDKQASGSFALLPPEVRARAADPQRLILTKANSRSTVHRPSYLDYIAVKRLNHAGEVVGENRFLGLFTHVAYSETITRIPVLRRKLTDVLAAAGLAADSHDGGDLAEILEVYPRDELFQTPVSDLVEVTAGVLRLRERTQTRLFLRKDIYGRYMSCLVYLPRDRYTTKARLRATSILRRALNGAQVDYSAMVGESPVARLHIVVRAGRGRQLADVDPAALEMEIAAAIRSWDDDLAEEARRQLGEEAGRRLVAAFIETIPETYKTDVPASAAVSDLARILELRESGGSADFELWASEGYVGGVPVEDGTADAVADRDSPGPRVWRLTIYRTGTPITLTDVLPRLQHMGVEVVDEHPYEFAAEQPFWIYDFGLRRGSAGTVGRVGEAAAPVGAAADGDAPPLTDSIRELVEGALAALWRGDIEDDGFNALVLSAHLTWRQVVVLRAYAKYLRQAGSAFSQAYMERVLRSNARVTRLLVRLFESRFDPSRREGEAERSEAITEEIRGELDDVASLDEDRILRAYWGLITATLRTNYFRGQRDSDGKRGAGRRAENAHRQLSAPTGCELASGRPAGAAGGDVAPRTPYLVVKLDAAKVPDLPAPRPKFELFVYSPSFEGVHLRFGSVARGGLRWSDRRDDFRTEILGLAKAQEVKNAVIVPSGAKGGFVCKQLPSPGDREAYQGEVLACYRMFISAMLDVTDNLEAGKIDPPSQVVRHDGDDPYLVVAADKGTATFSDTANEIALRRGFWLGDAFASGGSEGYDHKKMGITARGAWESVRFHFRTLSIDVDADDFTVVGIGDMSGDVFGNGMLLSRHIKIVGAFDHRHVFLDPDPDPAASFAERQRLFDLPRSSWTDYDTSLISAGGGVWPRSAKSVPIMPEARAALGMAEDVTALSPDQLISAMLTAPADLLWNGGVGTYVKATPQTDAEAGDRANDAVRVNASQLRVKVIGEGGNLGLTQQARIEYALAGG
ncbi:MAG: NAD-glutamate dehydrogenase, partial [Streptosporangiaceae bacterium]